MNFPHNNQSDNNNQNRSITNNMPPTSTSAQDIHLGASSNSFLGRGRGSGILNSSSIHLNNNLIQRTVSDRHYFNSHINSTSQSSDQLYNRPFISPESRRTALGMPNDGSFQRSIPNYFDFNSLQMTYNQGEGNPELPYSMLYNNSGQQRQLGGLTSNFNSMQQQSYMTLHQQDYYRSQYVNNLTDMNSASSLLGMTQITSDQQINPFELKYNANAGKNNYPPFSSHLSYKEDSGKHNEALSNDAYEESESEGEEGEKQFIENPTVVCRCVKSRCLKLYCDCFQAEKLCNTKCKCNKCLNTEAENGKGGRLKLAKRDYLLRKPKAFGKKRKKVGEGCACKNNRCLKKYCDCFRTEISCSEKCTCVSCENLEMQKRRYIDEI